MNNQRFKKLVLISATIVFAISVFTIVFLRYQHQRELIRKVTINSITFNVKIARSAEERAAGLMNVESMPNNEGMFFVYDSEGYRTFWMKDTLIPLDLIFIDDAKRIVDIIPNVQPCEKDPCEMFRSPKGAKYVFEINGGLSKIYGLKIADSVEISGI